MSQGKNINSWKVRKICFRGNGERIVLASEEPKIKMRASYRAVGFAHVLLGFLLALGFIGSVHSLTELAGMAWDLKLFFYLSLLVSACLFALLQILVRDADARRLWVRRLLLGVHFPLGLYLFPYLILPISVCCLPSPSP